MLLLLSPMSICQKTEALLKGVEAARFLSVLCMSGTFFQKEPVCLEGLINPFARKSSQHVHCSLSLFLS